jgi:hypothetical protein
VTAAQLWGLLLVAAAVALWFLARRESWEHHPDNPKARRRRPRFAGVWSADRRKFQLVLRRTMALLIGVAGVVIASGLLE